MGRFRFSEFSLSPRGVLQEPSLGGFELKESWIGFEWIRDESLSAEISFGTGDLVAPAVWFEPRTQDQLSLVQASVKAQTEYFDIRAGLLTLPNGYEGANPEWEWNLPETRARARNWFAKRDFGVELRSEAQSFMSSVILHNGESAENVDNRMWVTGQWRYLNSQGYGVLGTAEVGQTDSRSTSLSLKALDEGFNFDPNQAAKLRHGTLAFYRKWLRHLVLLEYGRGEILQNDQKNPYAWGHFDVCANLGGDLSLLLRYEQTQSNALNAASVIKSGGLGFSMSSSDRLSTVTLWANKHWESPEQQNDEALLIFRLSSNYL